MASQFHLIFLTLSLLLFISPSTSLTCSSEKFSGNTHFTNCTDLPVLKSFLHWTFDPTKSTLSVAFIAPPATPNGWVAWGLNPSKPAMVGTQTLIAFKSPNGSVIVKTYNLTSYKYINESKLSYNLLNCKAESSNGVFRIFATLELPENTTTLNHVWQVGQAVVDGKPVAHSFNPDNLKSIGTLDLANGGGDKKTGAPATSSSSSNSGGQSGNETGGTSRILKSENIVFTFLLFFVGVLFLQF